MSTASPSVSFPWRRAFDVRAAWASLWVGEFNPVFVKEMRQAVRGRLVLSAFSLVLLVMFGLSALLLLTSSLDDPGLGRQLLTVQLVALTALTGVCVPAWSHSRMQAERDGEDGVDLLYYTPMSTEEIIQGKFLSNATLTAVFFSAGAPFLAVTPLLRGVDAPTVMLVTGLNYLTVVSIGQAVLVLASLPLARIWKSLLTALAVMCSAPFVLMWVAGCMAYIYKPTAMSGLPLAAVAGMAAVFGLMGIHVLNVMAASNLAPKNGIYFRRVRPPLPKC